MASKKKAIRERRSTFHEWRNVKQHVTILGQKKAVSNVDAEWIGMSGLVHNFCG
jgi:hypothetical protein